MTDHCTWWPEGWWADCCAAHDASYATAVADRLDADLELARCVAESGDPLLSFAVAVVMLIGVRLFGRRYWRRAQRDVN